MTEQISGAEVLIETISNASVDAAISGAETLVEIADSASTAAISGAEILVEVESGTSYIAGAYLLVEIDDYTRPPNTTSNSPPVDNSHTPVDGIAQNAETVTIYTPTRNVSVGINLGIWKPTITNGVYNPEGIYVRSMENMQTSWSHTISVDGGFKTASAAMALTRGEMDDWISDGLGRHIVAFNESQERIFEGIVNKVSVTNGPLTHVRGPLMDIVNRLTMVYTPINPEDGTKGVTTETVFDSPNAGDGQVATSQKKWGIFEQVLNAGECTDDEVLQYRNLFLAEYSEPLQSNDVSIGGSGNGTVSLEIVGYNAFLDKFVYTSDSFLFATITEKLQAVLEAEPNGLFTDFSRLQPNGIAVPLWESDRGATGKSVIDSAVAQGDASDLRTFFGIYAHRQARYESRPTTVFYHQRLDDPAQRIYDAGGNVVLPWNVKPGKWLYIDDFAVTAPRPADLRYDPRALLIEQVSFSAPWGLSIQGAGSVRTLPQVLAKLGLRGKG